MDSPDAPLLELAVRRGLLSEDVRQALPRDTPEAPPGHRYGPRIDGLIRAGHLDEAVVRALLAELAAVEDTRGAPPARTGPLGPVPLIGASQPPFASLVDGRYAPLRLLGRGGMGSVYEARDLRLGRTVALKLLHVRDERTVSRVSREARAQARVQHTNVCAVYDAGVREGQSYVVMEYLPGQPLHVALPHLSLPDKLHIARQVAEALHAAHRLGVVHRDVKPSNVMVERREEGRWHATMTDFGLARGPGDPEGPSATGGVLGTPAYMPPEQARGRGGPLDPRADVYGLGALLYHLLTGAPPFSGDNVERILLRVLHEEPVAPRRRCPSLPRPLETLTLQCLCKDVNGRYASARAVSEDLRRYLRGEPLRARRASWRRRAWRWIRDHRTLATSLLLVLLGAGALGGLMARERALAQRRAALARRLAQEVETSELFLRAVYSLPLHDVRTEEGVVRERMGRISAELTHLTGLEAALAHHALGRAHLALREYARAVHHLRAALEGGVDESDVHLALGQALGARYEQARRQAEQAGDKQERETTLRRLDADLLAPARFHLRQGMSTSPEPKPYDEGLLDLYSQQYAAARSKAQEALRTEAWRYEARKLAADTWFAQGLHHELMTEHALARDAYERAESLYAAASDMARSDTALLLAQARLWTQRLVLDMYQGRPPLPAYERVLEACQRAALTHPEHPELAEYEYAAHVTLARHALDHGGDPLPFIEKALVAARRTLELEQRDPWAHRKLAETHLLQALHALQRGLPTESLLEAAGSHAREAATLAPRSSTTWATLGNLRALQGLSRLQRGEDAGPSLREALTAYKKALELEPDSQFAHENLARLYSGLIEQEQQQGRPFEALSAEARPLMDRALALAPGSHLLHRYRAAISASEGERAWRDGHEARAPLDAARADLETALALNPGDAESHGLLARVLRLRALAWPGPGAKALLTQALAEAEKAVLLNPTEDAHPLELTRVLVLMSRHEHRGGARHASLLARAAKSAGKVRGPRSHEAHALLVPLAREQQRP